VDFLKWIRDHSYGWIGPLVSITELVAGILLILALFSGIAAFIGAAMNFSYICAGSAGVNPLFIIISLFLIMAWRVAGWYGLDRIVLPWLGTPWQSGTLFRRRRPAHAPARSA
jgi:thiosulfate dehydrogenase [quinone] large subunit